VVLLASASLQLSAWAQGTTFTYQGRLNDGANPANGTYDLTFTLFSVSSGSGAGALVGGPLTNSPVNVSNGLFTVTLDFGANAFTGPARWLEIGVRTNGGGGFNPLTPRQPATPAPYAIYAASASAAQLSGTLGTSNLGGSYNAALTFTNANNNFGGNGGGLTNVNAAKLGGLPVAGFWQTSGNTGTGPGANILGTMDNQPLELWVNGTRAFRFLPTTNGAPNLIGGASGNVVDAGVVGATIAGGGTPNYEGFSRINYVRGDYGSIGGGIGNTASNLFTTVAGGFRNMASGDYATVGGGYGNKATGPGSFVGGGGYDGFNFLGNTASSPGATVGGGLGNTANKLKDTVSGGYNNTADGGYATVGGGIDNIASSAWSTVGGGNGNTAGGNYAAVPGGAGCAAAGDHSFAAGNRAKANQTGAFVWADSTAADFASTAANQFLIRASGGVGIGLNNPASQLHVASAGGSPQLQITQTSAAEYARLRLNVLGSPSWEMDVSPGATPAISWWNTSLRMNLDYNGNLTTSGTVNGTSDRNAKEKFAAISSRAVLEKVAALPISEWNFRNESAIRHIGPMAQDFYAAFNVGMDDKHIATVDADGVALAAIQGLNQKVEDLNGELKRRDTENKELKARLEKLERLMNSNNGGAR
jgi:hypothetical protein